MHDQRGADRVSCVRVAHGTHGSRDRTSRNPHQRRATGSGIQTRNARIGEAKATEATRASDVDEPGPGYERTRPQATGTAGQS